MNIKNRIAVWTAFVGLTMTSITALADDHAYAEGTVVKAGNIVSYRVISVEARGENDPDIYLVINYKNWAALDGATAKSDAIAKQVEGTLAASNQGAADRSKIRRPLGSCTGQELKLKWRWNPVSRRAGPRARLFLRELLRSGQLLMIFRDRDELLRASVPQNVFQ